MSFLSVGSIQPARRLPPQGTRESNASGLADYSRYAVTGPNLYSHGCLNRNARLRESGFHPAAIPDLTAGISAAIRSASPTTLPIYDSNSLHLNEPFGADQSLDYHERADRWRFGIYKTVPQF